MSIDVIGNFLTIIRNGLMVSKSFVVAPYSKIKFEIAQILKEEGFIENFLVENNEGVKKSIKIILKYVDGESVIHEIERVSTPGRRFYVGAADIKPVIGGLGISILTTSSGIFSNNQAKIRGAGGEVICKVW